MKCSRCGSRGFTAFGYKINWLKCLCCGHVTLDDRFE